MANLSDSLKVNNAEIANSVETTDSSPSNLKFWVGAESDAPALADRDADTLYIFTAL